MSVHATIDIYCMQEYLTLLSLIILLFTVGIFIRIPLLAWLFSLPYQFIVTILRVLKIMKEDHHWSVVYDSKTKLPIDPAYVTVHDTVGVEVASMITDINGRFALVLPQGLYTISVQKTNYVFPSQILNGVSNDGSYSGLYYGTSLQIVDRERAVAVAIPMDPVGTDWNQKEKKRRDIFFHFGNEMNYKGAELLYVIIGILLAGSLYVHVMNYFYLDLLGLYAVVLIDVLLWRVFEPTSYAHSVIFDKKTKLPMQFARVTIFNTHNIQIMRKMSSFEGQFTALLPSGKYYLTIERRNDHGQYSLTYTSPVFRVREGYIGKRFTV